MSNAIVRGIESEIECLRSARIAAERKARWEYRVPLLVTLALAVLSRDLGAVTTVLGVWASVEACVWYFGRLE